MKYSNIKYFEPWGFIKCYKVECQRVEEKLNVGKEDIKNHKRHLEHQ